MRHIIIIMQLHATGDFREQWMTSFAHLMCELQIRTNVRMYDGRMHSLLWTLNQFEDMTQVFHLKKIRM